MPALKLQKESLEALFDLIPVFPERCPIQFVGPQMWQWFRYNISVKTLIIKIWRISSASSKDLRLHFQRATRLTGRCLQAYSLKDLVGGILSNELLTIDSTNCPKSLLSILKFSPIFCLMQISLRLHPQYYSLSAFMATTSSRNKDYGIPL
jgi:hypothetical protein